MNNKPILHTILSPGLLNLYEVSDSIVVIIDVFRATSTIATALYNGAEKVIPVANVDNCIAVGKKLNAVTAGERDGKIIPGLQHGNSPAEYHREFIQNRILVLTTTNGTRLLHMALESGAAEVITGSFPNISSVCDHMIKSNKDVILGCSAWKNRFNLEDTLFAGALINKIKNNFSINCDSSLMAEEMYLMHKNDMHNFIRKTSHWRRLASYGLEKDLDYCITPDVANVLPVYRDGALVAENKNA
jgi:2-phosphosulfolactate phosphatase